MVQFKNLANSSIKEDRKIREQIFVAGETVTIYEPNKEDIDVIIDLQGDFVGGDDEEKIDVSGSNVVRVLFPLLTNIEGMEDLTDEEVEEIVENPTIALIQAQHVIEAIVIEVYKMVILSARKSLLEQDFQMETYKTSSEVIERTLGIAAKNNETSGAIQKIERAQSKFDKAAKLSVVPDEEQSDTEDVKNIGQHANEVAKFRAVFGESED